MVEEVESKELARLFIFLKEDVEMDLKHLENELLSCRACQLVKGGRGPTSWSGVPSPIIFIGEGPGGVEDEYGVPLVGPSGQLLDKALWSVGITRDKVLVTNIVKCRPPGNRTPTAQESHFCGSRWLDRELEMIRPLVIVGLGNVPLQYFLGADKRITKSRGELHQLPNGAWFMPTFHPAYLLRKEGKEQIAAKWDVFNDFKAALEKMQEIIGEQNLKSPEITPLLQMYQERKVQRAPWLGKILPAE